MPDLSNRYSWHIAAVGDRVWAKLQSKSSTDYFEGTVRKLGRKYAHVQIGQGTNSILVKRIYTELYLRKPE